MRITVKLFATYREIMGTSVLELDIPDGSNTGSLLAMLKEKNKNAPTEYAIVALNSEYVGKNAVIIGRSIVFPSIFSCAFFIICSDSK